MARWDDVRGVWRITATGSRPGEKRHRIVRSVSEPHTRAGRRKAESAETKLRAEILEALEFELPGGLEPRSFALAAAAWMDRHPEWSPKNVKETRYALRRYILPTLGATRLDEVTPTQIEALYGQWARKGFAGSGMRRWHGIVRAIFGDAERLGEIRINPMRRVRPAGGTAPERMHIPEPADVRRAIDNAATVASALFFELAAGTGARRGTLLALRWRDLDLESGTVTFRHAISVGEDGPVMKGTKTNRPYAVRLPEPVVEGLKAHYIRGLRTALALGISGNSSDLFVFSRNGGGTHWSVEYPSNAWRAACTRAGVVGCRLHDLRHFHATHLLARGVPYRVVAERLGCTESNIQKTYSHWVPTPEDARAAEVIAAVLGG